MSEEDSPHLMDGSYPRSLMTTRETAVENAAGRVIAMVALIALVLSGAANGQSSPRARQERRPFWAAPMMRDHGRSAAPNQLTKSWFQAVQFESEIPSPESEAGPTPRASDDGLIPVPDEPAPDDSLPELEEDYDLDDTGDDLLTLDEPASVYSTGTWFWNGCWYTKQDIVMLHRSRPRDVPIATNGGFSANLTTSTSSFKYAPGARLTLGHMFGRDRGNRDHMIQFTFFGLFDWLAEAGMASDPFNGVNVSTLLGGGNLAVLGFTTLPDATVDTQHYSYHSELNSYELNLRIQNRAGRDRMVLQPNGTWVRHITPSRIWSYFGGLRYMAIDEQFLYLSRGTVNASGNAYDGTYRVITNNDMVGIQIGGEFVEQYTEWSWGIRGRLGGLVNFGARRSRIDRVIDGVPSGVGEDLLEENLVFLSELSAFGTYQLRPNLAVRISYDFMFLNGIALATQNLGLDPTAGFPFMNIGGGALYQGGFVGFDMVW